MNQTETIFQDLIQQLNTATFKLDPDFKCTLYGKTPKWFDDLQLIDDDKNKFQIEVLFPFLETFLPEFDSIQKTNDQKIYSDLWSEVNSKGEEILLRAIGMIINDSKWILIMHYDSLLFNDRELLQKARELELHTENITRAKNELERLLRFKDQFISVVSHDLRSPISSVISATDAMLADKDFKETLNPFYFELIENINDDMNLLIEYNQKLYEWSTLQLGNLTINPKELNVKKLFNSLKLRFMGKVKEKNIEFIFDIDESIHVSADESLFSQALNNLIGNAIKFTPDKGEITVKAKDKSSQISISIADTGVGMSPEISNNLFSGYVKEHTSGTNGEKGTGLGLGICKRIMDAHGFDIGVKSAINQGTEFFITIS